MKKRTRGEPWAAQGYFGVGLWLSFWPRLGPSLLLDGRFLELFNTLGTLWGQFAPKGHKKVFSGHPKVRIVEDLGSKMTSKSYPGEYPGEASDPTLHKNMKNSIPPLIYHTSGMSTILQYHHF